LFLASSFRSNHDARGLEEWLLLAERPGHAGFCNGIQTSVAVGNGGQVGSGRRAVRRHKVAPISYVEVGAFGASTA